MAEYQVTERRPIRLRETRVMAAMARALARTPVTPNAISVASTFFCGLAGAAFYFTAETAGLTQRLLWLGAAAGIELRGLCNLLDGMVAVERKTASAAGELYNEAPDRVSDVAMLVGLGYAAGSTPALGYWAAIVAVLVAYARSLGKAAGAPQEYCGPMAKPQRMQLVSLAAVVLAAAPAAWRGPFWGPARAWSVPQAVLWVIILGGAWTAARRLRRAAGALRNQA